MPFTHVFKCQQCAETFDQKVSVGVEAVGCPSCGMTARRQFTVPSPMQIAINHDVLRVNKSDTLPESTASHSGNYIAHQRLAEFSDSIQAQREERNRGRKTFEQSFREKNPDCDLNKTLTKAESAELKSIFGAST